MVMQVDATFIQTCALPPVATETARLASRCAQDRFLAMLGRFCLVLSCMCLTACDVCCFRADRLQIFCAMLASGYSRTCAHCMVPPTYHYSKRPPRQSMHARQLQVHLVNPHRSSMSLTAAFSPHLVGVPRPQALASIYDTS